MIFNSTEWRQIFILAKQICRENKLKEFHYKFLHRITVTKKELCRFGVKQDSDCLYCGKEDSITEHTFINCQFSKAFQRRVIRWFNNVNLTNQVLQGRSQGGSWGARDPPFVSLFVSRQPTIFR